MLTELPAWWVRQMLDLLPQSWRPVEAGPRRALVIACDDAASSTTARCIRRRPGREMPVGQISLAAQANGSAAPVRRSRSEAVVLRLACIPLEREVTLPLAAETAAERVLAMEFDRFTPFAAEDVFWSWRVVGRDRSRGRLHAMVSMIPRAALTPLLTTLGRNGFVPGILESVLPDGTVQRIALQPPRRRRLRTWVIAGCVSSAVVAAIVAPFVIQQRVSADLDQQITELRPRVDRVEALRRGASGGAVDAAVVGAEQRRVGDVVRMLATVTDMLPDDTYLTALALRQRQLTMSGQSSAAARLIATLSGGSLIRNPAFTAPVIHNQGSGMDTFSLRAELSP